MYAAMYIGNTSLRVASPEQANSHSSDASDHGEQGYNEPQITSFPAKKSQCSDCSDGIKVTPYFPIHPIQLDMKVLKHRVLSYNCCH